MSSLCSTRSWVSIVIFSPTLILRIACIISLSSLYELAPTVSTLIGPLQDNGGPTPTHALKLRGPAIDAADVERCEEALPDGAGGKDQRGESRTQDGDGDGETECDIGAYEAHVFAVFNPEDDPDTDACEPAAPENCSLRGAILAANAHSPWRDGIIFKVTDPIVLQAALPMILDNLDIQGPEPRIVVDGDTNYRVFAVGYYADVTIDRMTIQNGVSSAGGGIYNRGNLSVTFCDLVGNSARWGGGIHNSGTLQVTNSTVSDNTASFRGRGIYNNDGDLTMTSSTLSGNLATRWGGGVFNDGLLRVSNSTFSQNGSDDGRGGGILNGVSSTATVIHGTFFRNWSTDGGGGVYNFGNLTLVNSIVAYSEDMNCAGVSPVTDGGHNIADDDTCGFANTDGLGVGDSVDPDLDADLQDNGGPTWTHALEEHSPAIDTADIGVCETDQPGGAGGVDQRGVERVDACDIGAFEHG